MEWPAGCRLSQGFLATTDWTWRLHRRRVSRDARSDQFYWIRYFPIFAALSGWGSDSGPVSSLDFLHTGGCLSARRRTKSGHVYSGVDAQQPWSAPAFEALSRSVMGHLGRPQEVSDQSTGRSDAARRIRSHVLVFWQF